MPKAKKKYKPSIIIMVIVVLAIVLMTLQIRTGRRPAFITHPIIYLYSSTHKLANYAVHPIIELWETYVWLVGIKQDNIKLQAELHRLREINNHYLEHKKENQRLRRLLEFKKEASIVVYPAQIISKDPSNWFKTVTIDKGSDDGIKVNQAVVTHQGVVGHIIEVTPKAAKVLLISDQNSSVAILIQENRAEGIMVGMQQGQCKINYLNRTAELHKGGVVITSGLGGIFPKGLRVGEITGIKKKTYGLFQDAEVHPYVDFSKLEEVLIIR